MRSRRLAALVSPSVQTLAADQGAAGRSVPETLPSPPSRWTATLLIAPLIVFLGAVYVIPFLGVAEWSVALRSVVRGQSKRLVSDSLVLSVFLRTFRVCATVTALSVAAAYAITYVWVRGSRWQRRLTELRI